MLAEARHVLPAPGSPVILTAMTLAMSCADLLFVKWRGLLSIAHCPSSPFQVYFMSCSNCCCCVGWVGSSREVGPCSLNDCLGICIGFILVVCAC